MDNENKDLSWFDTKISEAAALKQQGNIHYKEQRYEQAKEKYQQALMLLEPNSFMGASEEQCQQLADLSANLLFNVGTCCFNQQKWKSAQLIYSEALTINSKYVKALFKRAMARHEQGQYQKAMEDIKMAYELDRSNSDIREGYEKIRQRYNQELKKDNQKRKEMNAKIFNSASPAKKKQKAEQNRNNWWMLSLVPFAATAIYQGVKYFKS